METLPTTIVSGAWFIRQPKNCAAGVPTHTELNKDSPNSIEGRKMVPTGAYRGKTFYQLAFDAAIVATRWQFDQLESVELSANSRLGQASKFISSEANASDILSAIDIIDAPIEMLKRIVEDLDFDSSHDYCRN
jgi:hypothetical protein